MASDEGNEVGKLGCEWCVAVRSCWSAEGGRRRKDRECSAA